MKSCRMTGTFMITGSHNGRILAGPRPTRSTKVGKIPRELALWLRALLNLLLWLFTRKYLAVCQRNASVFPE